MATPSKRTSKKQPAGSRKAEANRQLKSLQIPLKIDGKEVDPDQEIRVAVRLGDGRFVSTTVQAAQVDQVTLELPGDTEPHELFIGPAAIEAEELPDFQALRMPLTGRAIEARAGATVGTVHPVEIEKTILHRFFWYCRRYTVTGRVVCPDGSPVPGAQVCAREVDWLWYWWSNIQVGCATTDVDGRFTITFRHCCGWWPWRWWTQRRWQLDPRLVGEIQRHVQIDPDGPGPLPLTSRPDPSLFAGLLNQDLVVPRLRSQGDAPEAFTRLRQPLLERLGPSSRLERLRIWPWYPLYPWFDCAPDLTFKVTQACGGTEPKVLLDQHLFQGHWNISTQEDIGHLVVSEEACCIDPTPQPLGDCILVTHLCNQPLSDIGGNLDSPATPVGYARPSDPGAGLLPTSHNDDRPFSGTLEIQGDFGTGAQADYYELEWLNPGSGTWETAMDKVSAFDRVFYGPELPAGGAATIGTHRVPFPLQEIDGRQVLESRSHFEDREGVGTWSVLGVGGRWWTENKTLLAHWDTDSYPEGPVRFRIRSWKRNGDQLENPKVLGYCGADDPDAPHEMVATLDHRVVAASSVDALGKEYDSLGKRCGEGSVHTCTDQPQTSIQKVEIVEGNGVAHLVDACAQVQVPNPDKVRITFRVYDPEGHLSHYDLVATYGDSGVRDVLAHRTSLTGAGGQVGPDYQLATNGQGAVAPHWYGGTLVVEIDYDDIFPIACAYQLELRAYKRTIVSCDGSHGHRNLSELSFCILEPSQD